ncbi:hypothetical protein AMEX_G9586 [Astyanax mexicanus]|uniref:Uncharacterized protein n=1 Tax=Astyanax mexicanus TaxID=7994 RepID=A0A8T2LUK8_ASTMX|nr:hypothetical protein AMEX_G9586 [Astyanax mexicanus]
MKVVEKEKQKKKCIWAKVKETFRKWKLPWRKVVQRDLDYLQKTSMDEAEISETLLIGKLTFKGMEMITTDMDYDETEVEAILMDIQLDETDEAAVQTPLVSGADMPGQGAPGDAAGVVSADVQ